MESSVEDFMAGLSKVDAEWQARAETAAAEGKRLQYVGVIESGRLNIGVRAVEADSPFGTLHV
jgi:aspartokinase/homoserine dehydrogenase 1